MAKWMLGLMLVSTAWLSACGSDGGDDDDDATSTPSPSATVSYFVQTDSDAINEVAAEVHRLYGRAVADKQFEKCDRAGAEVGYPAWRRCWHGLLDPLAAAYRDSATVFEDLIDDEFPETCQEGLAEAADGSRDLSDEITGLLDDIDSDARRDQKSAMSRYFDVVNEAYAAYSEPFQPLTSACYSPEDLATITPSSPTDSTS